MGEYGWSAKGYHGPAAKGYGMVTVWRGLFKSRLWKLTYRYPMDYPIDAIHLFGNYYWMRRDSK